MRNHDIVSGSLLALTAAGLALLRSSLLAFVFILIRGPTLVALGSLRDPTRTQLDRGAGMFSTYEGPALADDLLRHP
ncbi:hypothetical protein XI07_19100 [Bradyrhizobium sp. CCBAU 11445]|nr:hypothetical protein [Bradyrhizobium sp. CCBAU 11445]MDA9522325.1 hypothetical protein [Bradyrhizobium sp. CCBAU 11434]